MKQKFSVTGMTCSACQAHVEKAVKHTEGVQDVQVNLLSNSMVVTYDQAAVSPETIIAAVQKAGYGAALPGKTETKPQDGMAEQLKEMKRRLIVSFAFMIPLMYVSMGHMFGWPLPWFLHGDANAVTFAMVQLLLALPIGYFSGVNKHNAAGKAINTSALVVMAVPAFWVGILLMYFFGLKLHWFPISGWGDTFGEHVWSLILPAFTQSLGISALLIRNMQNEVAQIFTIDYVDFARSKGLAPMRVRVWYILRNVMISTTTLFSIGIASMLGGSVIIETVFSLPGLGSLIMSSILAK